MKMMRNDINDAFCVLMENDDDKKLQVEIFSVFVKDFIFLDLTSITIIHLSVGSRQKFYY